VSPGVAASSAIWWRALERAQGDAKPKALGDRRSDRGPRRLDPLALSRRRRTSRWRFFERRGITFKKDGGHSRMTRLRAYLPPYLILCRLALRYQKRHFKPARHTPQRAVGGQSRCRFSLQGKAGTTIVRDPGPLARQTWRCTLAHGGETP
jgi:hypothetical protein